MAAPDELEFWVYRMITEPLILIALCILVYGVFSQKFSNTIVSAPMLFTLAGLAAGGAGLGIVDINVSNRTLEGFGELTLGFILFADAAMTNSRSLVRNNQIPIRLLGLSLPLTILAGAVAAHWLFPSLTWTQAALIAAILAPTDAALGVAVVASKVVPEKIRQGVLVESGLNDGLALPAILLFAALSFSAESGGEHGAGYWIQFAIAQVVVGSLVGIIGGGILGKIIHYADGQGWIAHEFRNLTSIGAAVLLLLCAHVIGGNGFIAAFTGGLVFGSFCKRRAGSLTEFVEEEGQLFSLLIFFFFGAVLLPTALSHFTVYCVIYALLSLTVIRMAPTYLALTKTGLAPPSKLFVGWFGPRGLASILFLFIAIDHGEMGALQEIEAVVYVTVFLSIMLHGLSAAPLVQLYKGKPH